MPTLHVEGRWLVDKHGNQVVLHGVMDTPSNYFNGGRWHGNLVGQWTDGEGNKHDVYDNYNESGKTACLDYFEKLKIFTCVLYNFLYIGRIVHGLLHSERNS